MKVFHSLKFCACFGLKLGVLERGDFCGRQIRNCFVCMRLRAFVEKWNACLCARLVWACARFALDFAMKKRMKMFGYGHVRAHGKGGLGARFCA